MRRATVAMALLLSVGPGGAVHARDSEYKLLINEIVQNPEFKARLGDDIAFRFGDGKVPAGAQRLGEFVTNKKTNSFGKPDEDVARLFTRR